MSDTSVGSTQNASTAYDDWYGSVAEGGSSGTSDTADVTDLETLIEALQEMYDSGTLSEEKQAEILALIAELEILLAADDTDDADAADDPDAAEEAEIVDEDGDGLPDDVILDSSEAWKEIDLATYGYDTYGDIYASWPERVGDAEDADGDGYADADGVYTAVITGATSDTLQLVSYGDGQLVFKVYDADNPELYKYIYISGAERIEVDISLAEGWEEWPTEVLALLYQGSSADSIGVEAGLIETPPDYGTTYDLIIDAIWSAGFSEAEAEAFAEIATLLYDAWTKQQNGDANAPSLASVWDEILSGHLINEEYATDFITMLAQGAYTDFMALVPQSVVSELQNLVVTGSKTGDIDENDLSSLNQDQILALLFLYDVDSGTTLVNNMTLLQYVSQDLSEICFDLTILAAAITTYSNTSTNAEVFSMALMRIQYDVFPEMYNTGTE